MASGSHNNGDGFYLRLEVAPTASHDEIVRAYRRLAHGAHPDAHPEDPDAARRFREITEAYEVLGDPTRRASYDAAERRRSIASHLTVTKEAGEASRPARPGTPGQGPPIRPLVAGAPVFVGARQHPVPLGQLWAGPVRVEGPDEGASDLRGQIPQTAARLVAALLEAWWW